MQSDIALTMKMSPVLQTGLSKHQSLQVYNLIQDYNHLYDYTTYVFLHIFLR